MERLFFGLGSIPNSMISNVHMLAAEDEYKNIPFDSQLLFYKCFIVLFIKTIGVIWPVKNHYEYENFHISRILLITSLYQLKSTCRIANAVNR